MHVTPPPAPLRAAETPQAFTHTPNHPTPSSQSNSVTKRSSASGTRSSEPALEAFSEGNGEDHDDETTVALHRRVTSDNVNSGGYAGTGEEDGELPPEPKTLMKQRSAPCMLPTTLEAEPDRAHRRIRSQGSSRTSQPNGRRKSVGGASKELRKTQVTFLTQRDLEDQRMWQEEKAAAKARGSSNSKRKSISWQGEQATASGEGEAAPAESDTTDDSRVRGMRSQSSQESQESQQVGYGDGNRHGGDDTGGGGDLCGEEEEGASKPDRRSSTVGGVNPMHGEAGMLGVAGGSSGGSGSDEVMFGGDNPMRRASGGRRRSSASSVGGGRRRSSLISPGLRCELPKRFILLCQVYTKPATHC